MKQYLIDKKHPMILLLFGVSYLSHAKRLLMDELQLVHMTLTNLLMMDLIDFIPRPCVCQGKMMLLVTTNL